MKIKKVYKSILRNDEYIYDVFGIYWGIDLLNKYKTYFLCLDSNDNLSIVYSLDEIEIIDHSINFKTVFFNGDNNKMPAIFHWSLIEKNLLDGVIDGREKEIQEFLSIIRHERLIDW